MKNALTTLSLALLPVAAAGGAEGRHPDELAIARSYQQLEQAILKQDSAAVLRLYAPQFTGWGPALEPLSRQALAEVTPGQSIEKINIKLLSLKQVGTAYNVVSQTSSVGAYHMGGQKIPFTQQSDALDVWQKVAGRWQIVSSRAISTTMEGGGEKLNITEPVIVSVAQRATIRRALQPLLRPIQLTANAPASDLGFLQPLAAAKVIGVGEGSHGSHEHFVVKGRIFRELVTRYGFTTLAFESNMAGGEAVNAYISGQSADLKAAVVGLGFGVWQTQEVADLLKWMREYNAARGNKPALKFLAIDMQDPAGSAALLGQLNPSLGAAAAPFARLKPYELNELLQDPAKQKTYTGQAQKLVQAVGNLPGDTPRRTELQALARTVQQSVLAATGAGDRDDFMAENLLAALRADPAARVMLWAHNGHVSKAPAMNTSMGKTLAAALGGDYRTIGQSFASGSVRAVVPGQEDKGFQTVALVAAHPESLDALAGGKPGVLVLAEAQKVPALRNYLATPRPLRGAGQNAAPGSMNVLIEALPSAYDVLLLTGKSTPTVGFGKN